MKDWEKYEHQIFDKLREEFPDSDIKKDQRIKGIFSERSRQIDILVVSQSIGRELKIIIDCKKFSKNINLKTVESFIGFCEDVGAHIGIMITNVGYSKGAQNRIKKYHRDIKLDVVKFIDFDEYHFDLSDCSLCRNDDGIPRGYIFWDEPLPLIKDGLITLIHQGKCSYCGELHIKCQGCGEILDFGPDYHDVECMCEHIFGIESEYVGNGMTEEHIYIKERKDEPPKFIDPNQIGLFD
ncbi:hypothetical protein GO009_16825 [Muricauda sp. TY007]|uniref:restriction endonuclease n=1 Tax=Allomuricauda sp. TY007 TaxID=2683200 RepID=UPI0013BF85F1|nr:restriction endonuclease [Muricauda sp. TY007]NDV17684.1 hypothetical protein [Muricauda sp. TY007]